MRRREEVKYGDVSPPAVSHRLTAWSGSGRPHSWPLPSPGSSACQPLYLSASPVEEEMASTSFGKRVATTVADLLLKLLILQVCPFKGLLFALAVGDLFLSLPQDLRVQ